MRKKFKDRVRLVVYLDRDEYELACRESGRDSLSSWAHRKLFATIAAELPERYKALNVDDYVADGIMDSAELQENAKKFEEIRRKGTTCPHGIERGWRCTLCGGIVPVKR